jgi:hypothetical protein
MAAFVVYASGRVIRPQSLHLGSALSSKEWPIERHRKQR